MKKIVVCGSILSLVLWACGDSVSNPALSTAGGSSSAISSSSESTTSENSTSENPSSAAAGDIRRGPC